MKRLVVGALLLAALAAPASILADSIGSASTTSGGIKGTLYLDYNSQYCSNTHSTKYQLVWNRADWDRLNTSWQVGSASIGQREYGSTCANALGSLSQSWSAAPVWGNTGNSTHAQGATHYVSWGYLGSPFVYAGDAWIGAHLSFYGTSYYGKGASVCVAVNVQDWPC